MATHLKCSPNLCNLQLSYQKKKKKRRSLGREPTLRLLLRDVDMLPVPCHTHVQLWLLSTLGSRATSCISFSVKQ